MEKMFISLPDAAKKYGCSQDKLRMAAKRGVVHKYKQLGGVYFDAEELARVMVFKDVSNENVGN